MELELDEPLLDRDEEADLARWIEAGHVAQHLLVATAAQLAHTADRDELVVLVERGEQARQRFVLANLKLVVAESNRASRRWGQAEDELFQEGVSGLLMAVDRFDHDRGLRFATYALPWIRSFIFKAVVSRASGLHLSAATAEARRVARRVSRLLGEKLGRPPEVAEVAAAMGRPEPTVAALLTVASHTSMTGAEGTIIQWADPAAEEAFAEVEQRMGPLGTIPVHLLDASDRWLLDARFGLAGDPPRSREEVGAELGLSATTVRRREASALGRLRRAMAREEAGEWVAPLAA